MGSFGLLFACPGQMMFRVHQAAGCKSTVLTQRDWNETEMLCFVFALINDVFLAERAFPTNIEDSCLMTLY